MSARADILASYGMENTEGFLAPVLPGMEEIVPEGMIKKDGTVVNTRKKREVDEDECVNPDGKVVKRKRKPAKPEDARAGATNFGLANSPAMKVNTIRFRTQRDNNSLDVNLPPVTLEYLAHGAPEGSRNDALMHAACQVRDAELLDEMEEQLIERAVADGLRESEARATIRSVRSREAREPITGSSSSQPSSQQKPERQIKVKPINPSDATEEIELLKIDCSWQEFLRRAYKPGEKIFLATDAVQDGEKWTPTGKTQEATLEQWLESGAESSFNKEAGVWIAINPFKEWGRRVQENVAAFRYVMIESDHRTKTQQFENLKNSGLPIAFVIDSGGKSLHAWIRVEAKDFNEYKARRDTIYALLRDCGIDTQNKDASRLSRLPGVQRGTQMQHLVAENIGANNWEEWEEWEASMDSTEWFTNNSLRDFDRKSDPSSLIGNRWLCRGGSLVIQGYTGIGKSSFALQMALRWAVGKEFFGIPTSRPLRTVFLQAENDLGDFAEAFQDITSAFTPAENALVDRNFMAGREATVCGAVAFAAKVRKMVKDFRPDIIFCDPLLSYFGNDISKQEQASKFFRQSLQPIQNETGIIIVFVHHLGKPLQNGQRQGPSHYQGLGSSDIINWTRETIMLTQEGNTFVMELGKRAKRAGFTEKFLRHSATGVCWEEAQGVETREDAKMRAEKQRREQLRGFVFHHGIVTLTQMKDRARDFGYSQNTIKTALDAIAQNEVGCDEPIYCFEAHVNGSRYVQTVYSTHTRPEDGNVESKDLDGPVVNIVRLNGQN